MEEAANIYLPVVLIFDPNTSLFTHIAPVFLPLSSSPPHGLHGQPLFLYLSGYEFLSWNTLGFLWGESEGLGSPLG